MKLYTKSGDKGKTGVIGRARLMKDSIRVSAYGEIDELNSLIGLIVSQEAKQPVFENLTTELQQIQQFLFDAGTDAANLDQEMPLRLDHRAVTWLEEKIDSYSEKVPPIEKFILPGGTGLSSWLHYARSVTRRVERSVVTLYHTEEMNPEVLQFINRLSDYFFVVARFANHQEEGNEIFYENSDNVFKN